MDVARQGRGLVPQWRGAMWGSAVAILLAPAIAMFFTNEVRWTASDFVAAGLLLLSCCAAVELCVRYLEGSALKVVGIMAVVVLTLLIWAEGAVGIF